MEIKTAFEIGDLIWHKFSNNSPNSKKTLWEKNVEFQAFQIMEIKTSCCYGGTQVFYEARPLHVIYESEKKGEVETRKYMKTLPGWSNDGKISCLFREDEIKLIDEAVKADILNDPLKEQP